MNCKQANTKITIRNILQSFSLFPSKENSRSAFYFAFDREEKTPSLSVNFVENTAFDFGTGKKYDNVSLVQGIKKCSVSEALQYLSQFDISFQKQTAEIASEKNKYELISLGCVKHVALIQYLKSRNIFEQKNQLSEIHYQIKGKNFFGVGFKNDSGGYEIRNKYAKICLGKKDITTIKNRGERMLIFEGFLDYLSLKQMLKPGEKFDGDVIILNSVLMISRLPVLNNYNEIKLFLDNDFAGDKGTDNLVKLNKKAVDKRSMYGGFKDLNDCLCGKFGRVI